MKEVQVLPAEKQLEAVAKELVELNPKFDGQVVKDFDRASPIENGLVTNIKFFTNDVVDISPLRALPHLHSVTLNRKGNLSGKVRDIRALSGLKLTNLNLYGNPITDFRVLAEFPLRKLSLNMTTVADADLPALYREKP